MQPYTDRIIDCLAKGKMEDFYTMLQNLKTMDLEDENLIRILEKIYKNQTCIDKLCNAVNIVPNLKKLLSYDSMTEFDFQIIKIIIILNRDQANPENNHPFLEDVFKLYAHISSKYDSQLEYFYYLNRSRINKMEGMVYLRSLIEKYSKLERIKEVTQFKIHLAWTYIALHLPKSGLIVLDSIDRRGLDLLKHKGKMDFHLYYSMVYLNIQKVKMADKFCNLALNILEKQKLESIAKYYFFLPNILSLYTSLKKYKKVLSLTEDVLLYKTVIPKFPFASILINRITALYALGYSTEKCELLFNQLDEIDFLQYNKGFALIHHELNIKRHLDQKKYGELPSLFSKYIELKSQLDEEASLVNVTNTELSLEIQSRDDLIEREKVIHEMKNKLFSNITHELRTPLTLTMSPLLKILERDIDSETRLDVFHALQNSKRSLYLVNQLLDINKLESGLYKPIHDYGDVILVIENILHQIQPWIAEKKLRLKIHHEYPIIFSQFDYDKSEKIVYNVVSNALKYSPIGGKIMIDTKIVKNNSQSFLQCSVKDYGKGIKEEDSLKVFDRFYRGEEEYMNQTQGTGIGLALVKEFLELLGGKVELKTKLGKGSEFILYIPISDVSFDKPKIGISEQFARMNTDYNFTQIEPIKKAELCIESKEHSLLIIEDNPQLINFLVQMFNSKYTIYTAINGQEGYKKAQRYLPHVIISDIMMPIMDGIEMTNELKSHELTNHIPIILLSAKSSHEAKIESRGAGADHYFTKPFHPEDIRLTVENILSHQEKMKKKFQGYFSKGIYDKTEGELDTFIKKVIDVINNNYENEGFNVNSLIKLLNISKSKFNIKLKKYCTYSPRELIESVRMHKARKILETTDFNITEIAYMVGYADSSSFTRVFKRTFNSLPIAFKKR